MRTTYPNHARSLLFLMFGAFAAVLVGCSSGNQSSTTNSTATTTATTTAATVTLSASNATVPSDNSASTTVTVTAVSSTNAALPGVVVTLSSDTGILSTQTVTTGTDGTATFTFRSGTSSLANRTATITASAGATAQLQIQIAGSTLSVFGTTGSNVPNDGTSPVTITFIAKNAQGVGLASTPYTVSWVTTTGGHLTLNTTSGNAGADGKFSVIVAGTGSPATGTATVTASAAGATASATINVTAVSGTFGISKTSNSTGPVVTINPTAVAMTIADSLTVTVSAPSSASVTFTTTQGKWGNGLTSQTVVVAGGVASAILTQTQAGQANVQVSDGTNSASLVVGVTATTPYSITLTATPTVVAKGGGTSTLIAKVMDANNQPVGNAAVAFSMSNTTGGGENVSPAVAYTTAIAGGNLGLGEARVTFTAGSLSSSATGVQVRATVQNTAVVTNTPPSGNDAAIVIGGTAGSIAFGMATQITDPGQGSTYYQYPMSVQVADSNGNPMANTIVNLSVWPAAWSTGMNAPCAPDADDGVSKGTFVNEDLNKNLILDSGEDGYRKYFVNGVGGAVVAGGTKDGLLTPVNSAAGTLPGSVTTDANGVAAFNLTYQKTSAIWTIDTIRASTTVQCSETVSQITFRLPASKADATPPTSCYLASPYNF